MKIYVAGKTNDFERVRRIQRMCVRYGHTISYDWTKTVETVGEDGAVGQTLSPEFKRECAMYDEHGVDNADLIIAVVDHPNITGTLIEIGMAIALRKEIWLVGEPPRDSVFFYGDQIKRKMENELSLIELLPYLHI